jgi:hypothetical protein
MEGVVAPVLHNREPVNPDTVNKEFPQLLTTSTTGIATDTINGAATPLPGVLVHPFTVCVTVYVPAVVTVIDAVVSPVLHNKEPVNPVAVNMELPQLSTTVTDGAGGTGFGAAVPVPAALVHPFTVCVTV